MKLPKELTTITPLSKYLAMVVFIAIPIVGFFLGIKYQEMLNLAKNQEMEANLTIPRAPTPTPIAMPTTDPSIIANWKTYKNEKYRFEIMYPPDWKVEISNNESHIDLASIKVDQKYRDASKKIETEGFAFNNGIYLSIHETDQTLEEFIQFYYNNPDSPHGNTITSIKDVQFPNGMSAVFVGSNTGGYGLDSSTLLKFKNYIFRFTKHYGGSFGLEKYTDQQFNQILSTFRFVKQKPVIPTDKQSCEAKAKGGTWEKTGLLQSQSCVLPTSDAGESCTDSSQCESVCVADDNILPDTKTTGKCYERTQTLGTCLNYVLDGKAQGTLCAD